MNSEIFFSSLLLFSAPVKVESWFFGPLLVRPFSTRWECGLSSAARLKACTILFWSLSRLSWNSEGGRLASHIATAPLPSRYCFPQLDKPPLSQSLYRLSIFFPFVVPPLLFSSSTDPKGYRSLLSCPEGFHSFSTPSRRILRSLAGAWTFSHFFHFCLLRFIFAICPFFFFELSALRSVLRRGPFLLFPLLSSFLRFVIPLDNCHFLFSFPLRPVGRGSVVAYPQFLTFGLFQIGFEK